MKTTRTIELTSDEVLRMVAEGLAKDGIDARGAKAEFVLKSIRRNRDGVPISTLECMKIFIDEQEDEP